MAVNVLKMVLFLSLLKRNGSRKLLQREIIIGIYIYVGLLSYVSSIFPCSLSRFRLLNIFYYTRLPSTSALGFKIISRYFLRLKNRWTNEFVHQRRVKIFFPQRARYIFTGILQLPSESKFHPATSPVENSTDIEFNTHRSRT